MARTIQILLIFLYSSITIYCQSSINFPPSNISSKIIKRHLNFLGSDLFEGRGTGTMGGSLSAKYLAIEFEKMNLKPIASNNTYYQYIPMHGSFVLPSSELKIVINNEEEKLVFKKDYLLYKSGQQTFLPSPVEMVFVGYGIIAPEFDYNDYQSVDVEGKIVVMLSGEPSSNKKDYFNGTNPTVYSYPESKQRLALSRGAKGSIIIDHSTAASNVRWKTLANQFSFEDVTLAYNASSNFSLLINSDTAEKLFRNSKYEFPKIIEQEKNNSISSFEMESEISFKGSFRERDFIAPNIVGMIEGSDKKLKEEYIIVSAHYDHLGVGPVIKGDSLYNGVFDNAIGCAALLEIAKSISTLEQKPKRSIIFLLTTGEEKGLLGSTYYVDHPIKPLYKTVAALNIDGVASFDNFKSVIGVGREYSTLGEDLRAVTKKFNLSIVDIPAEFYDWESFNRSDQIAFAKAGIPSILIVDGPDYLTLPRDEAIRKFIDYNKNVYHTPFDDLKKAMNFNAVEQHVNLLFGFIYYVAVKQGVPEWNSNIIYSNTQLRNKAEKK